MSQPADSRSEHRKALERRLADLSPAKRALLERAGFAGTSGASGAAVVPSVITPRPSGAPVPMSFSQELVWLLEQVNPGNVYNVPRVARFRGALDLDALEQALAALVARHEVLRTRFDLVDGMPQQLVQPPAPVPVARIDLRTLPAAEREDAALRQLRELTHRPFDLAHDLQLRATLLQMSDDEYILLLESHHVASDEWSRNILLRELSALYDGYCAGRAVALAPLALQYGDYALWERAQLQGERLVRLMEYWRGQLGGAPARLELPTDRPRPATPSFDGAQRVVTFPRALLDQLRDVSRAHDVTLFTTLLAAFNVLLARYCGQDDVVVGLPVAGRTHPEIQDIVGYFTNTLVLRTRLPDNLSFAGLLAQVRDTCLGAYEHQEMPYEKLVLELQREQPDRVPNLQVSFTLQDPGRASFQLHGTTTIPFMRLGNTAKFELSLSLLEQEDGLRALVEYRTDLFDATTVDRMLTQYQTLLTSIVRAPEAPLRQLSLINAAERDMLTSTWNATAAPYPADHCLHACIAAQAARTPDAIAVETERARLTFAELHSRAGALARYLRARGVGPGIGVGLCAERSIELVVGMLGILQAGGYYVPLDPEYPAERVAFMLDDAQVPVLLTASNVRGVLPASAGTGKGPDVVLLDTDWETIAATSDDFGATSCDATPDDLAYVIYTSGSTGRPKGVMIPHRAVVNYLSWMQAAYGVGSGDAILQKAPASFDASIWEFFLPLVSGARLVLARSGGHQDPAYLVEVLERHDITLLQLVPSQLQLILDVPGVGAPQGLPRLRRLFLGGEALPAELLTRVTTACPSLPVTNLYGPTEATVYSTSWNVEPGTWHGGSVSIGRPIANTVILLLDRETELVPLGVPGELCIGGAGVARGYLRRPELTAEKFIPNPIAMPDTARLYRTGDRARYRADGTLEYLGRIDTQVKLRGFRIELGEIESALAGYPEIQSAAAIVREDTPGDQRLVAYCILEPGHGQTADLAQRLRERLKNALPAFMVPGTIVWMEQWPLNANGKLDRAALPRPQVTDAARASRAYVPPEGPIEDVIAGIWQEVLGVSRIGVEHDFFELGGHSILAMQVAARVSRLFGPRISLRSFFEHSTVRSFAAVLVAQESKPGHTALVAQALLKLRNMSPEERERRRAAASGTTTTTGQSTHAMTETV